MEKSSFQILIEKLDEFIRKYYVNQLIKGAIYTGAIFFTAIIVFSLIEYFARFDSLVRGVLFYTFLGLLIYTLSRWIILPLVKLRRIGKIISYEEASSIIGNHFGEVKDKLLNVLQLKQNLGRGGLNEELLIAGIDQKIGEMSPVPFNIAIDLNANRKHIKYVAVPAILLLVLGLSTPELILQPSERILKYSSDFQPQAPFDFLIQNDIFTSVKNEDYKVLLKMKGNTLPNEVYIENGGRKMKLDKQGKTDFYYIFKNMQEDASFRFYADGFYSEIYSVKVLPNPLLLGFEVTLEYPAYLRQESEKIANIGDLTIAEGTKVTWNLSTENTNKLTIGFNNEFTGAIKQGDDNFTYSLTALESMKYTLHTANEFHSSNDSVRYRLEVIKDELPEIAVKSERDTLEEGVMHFFGRAGDDHGLRTLSFNFRKMDNEEDNTQFKSEPISFDNQSLETTFYYFLSAGKLELKPGEEIQYYFEVSDNDGVNGSKYSRTPINTYKMASVQDMQKKADRNQDKIKDELSSAVKEAKKIKQELAELSRKLIDKKQAGWQDKELLKNILEKQQALQERVNEIKEQYEENNKYSNEFRENNEELMEKQEQLKELMENLMTEEMKQQMEEIQALLEKVDKEKLKDEIEKMQLSNEDLEKELDRSLELFKQMEFEQKLQETMNDLDRLKKEQEDLKEKLDDKDGKETEQMSEEQEKLNKDFEDVKEKLADLEKKNNEMEFPNKMEDTEEMQEDISKEMKDGLENMRDGKSKKAQQHQQKATESMQQLANTLNSLQEGMKQKQAEDINALRQLLDNIITSSFEQEELMDRMQGISNNDPNYITAMIDQKKIRDNVKLVEDSLFALSKRVVQLQSMINKEINSINYNIDNALKEMQERRTDLSRAKQQVAMTSLNNLALMLDEVVHQMQLQMAMKMPGQGSCDKPGQGKGKPKPGNSMGDMQKMLNEQLKSLKEGMNKGESGQPKGEGGNGMNGKMSKELAKMAARQAAIREEMNKMSKSNEGGGQMGEMKKLSELMEQTETDIVNKRITRETLKRQEDILTRLLESEKAERERELDKERKSTEHTTELDRNQQKLLEYFERNQNEVELLRTMIPSYNEFYKKKVSEYFKLLAE